MGVLAIICKFIENVRKLNRLRICGQSDNVAQIFYKKTSLMISQTEFAFISFVVMWKYDLQMTLKCSLDI